MRHRVPPHSERNIPPALVNAVVFTHICVTVFQIQLIQQKYLAAWFQFQHVTVPGLLIRPYKAYPLILGSSIVRSASLDRDRALRGSY